ncbi:MAG: sialidase family protein [Akkermansiaceae bacterium]|jgi:sialidase-1
MTQPSLFTRRKMFTCFILASAAFLFATFAMAAPPKATIHDIKTISFQPDLYCGWPTVTRRANGELLVVWSGGRAGHVCPFGRVDMMRSNDKGETWTFPRVVLDTPIDDRDAGVLETAKGSILITTFTSLAYESYLERKKGTPEEAKWLAAHHRINAEERKALLGSWVLRSTDGGQTFSAPSRVPVNSPHGPIQLADGRLLYAGKKLWTDEKKIGVAESQDDGVTWKWLAEIPTRPGDSALKSYHELHAIEAANGTLIAHIRNHNPAHKDETLQSESHDGGKTWSVPHSIGVWGLPSFLTRLSDDRLLMTYGYRRKPHGNQARISDDHGSTWSGPITISDDGVSSDLGYPSTVQLADGTLLTIWYENPKDSSKAVLRQARWSLNP